MNDGRVLNVAFVGNLDLAELNLSYNNIGSRAAAALSQLKAKKSLVRLNINGNDFSKKVFKSLKLDFAEFVC